MRMARGLAAQGSDRMTGCTGQAGPLILLMIGIRTGDAGAEAYPRTGSVRME